MKCVLVGVRSVSDDSDTLTNVVAEEVSVSSTGVSYDETVESLEGADGVVENFLPGRLGALEYEDEEDDPLEGSEGSARAARLAGVP